jgi:serine/threonine protein kinase
MMECVRCRTPLPDSARFCLTCGLDVSGNHKEHTVADSDPELQSKLQEELGQDFLIERELGHGGMAVVYLAMDVHIGRKVAVKVLPPALTYGHGAGFVDRFKREARTAGTLEHPHIIPIHRVSTEGKLFWYIMKYIDGEGLDAVLKREGQLTLRQVADILAPTADALDYAHKKGVIHRDIKPANLLLDTEGKVTITDFGIAKAFLGESLTVSGSILGTPYYMSPEQCAGKTLDGAADQYSLAVMAYQMLAGHLPFSGESAVEIIKKHTLDPVPPISILRPGMPQNVSAALQRALAKTPEERFGSVKEFVRAMEFSSEERTAPLSEVDRVSITGVSQPLIIRSDPNMVSASTPTGVFRRTQKVMLASFWAKVGTISLPWSERLKGWVEKIDILWKGLGWRTQLAVTSGSVVTLVAVMVAAWPRGGSIADGSQQTVDRIIGSPQTADGRPQTADRRPAPSGPTARLALRLTPAGTAITVDGAPVRADSIRLTLGKHVLGVSKDGYGAWLDTITATDTTPLTRAIALVALPSRVSLSTSLPATLFVNGVRAANPSTDLEVPPGQVRVRFQVRDSEGKNWEADSVLTVRPGATLVKRFTLATSALAARRARPVRIPSAIGAQVLTVPAAEVAAALANGYAAEEIDLLSTRCGRFVEMFWDVLGYDVDLARICAASALIVVKGHSPERMLNFTRFVRTKDGAIETVEKPSATAELRNEVSGKRIGLRLRNDSIVVTDLTPNISVTRAPTRRAERRVSVRRTAEGVNIVRIDAFGVPVKTPRDSLPVVGSASHNHRIGSCTGPITFDGERFRYAPSGEHKYTFSASEIISGTVSGDRGSLRFKVGASNERLSVRGWESVFEAAIVARSP